MTRSYYYDSDQNKSFAQGKSAPEELQRIDQWIVWQPKDGKKPPVNPEYPEYNIDPTDPGHFLDFDTAAKYAESISDAGLGFVLSELDPYLVIDYDGVRDPQTGEIHPDVGERIDQGHTYFDVSPSGTGVHEWIRADGWEGGNPQNLPDLLVDHPDFPDGKVDSVLACRTYATVTGKQILGTTDAIGHDPDWLAHLAGEERDRPEERVSTKRGQFDGATLTRLNEARLGDSRVDELVKWAEENGDPAAVGFPENDGDRSRGACALAYHLMWWFELDGETVKRVMDDLGTPRWSEESDEWKDRILKDARRDVPDTYEPNRSRTLRTKSEYDALPEISYKKKAEVVNELADDGPLHKDEIAERLDRSKRQTGRYLKKLKEEGRVIERVDGRKKIYALEEFQFEPLQ